MDLHCADITRITMGFKEKQCHSIAIDVCKEVPKEQCVDEPLEKCMEVPREQEVRTKRTLARSCSRECRQGMTWSLQQEPHQ